MADGSGNLKIKLYLAVKTLVESGQITDRLRRATWVICNLVEHDFTCDLMVWGRFEALKNQLTVKYRLLVDDSIRIPADDEAERLANELLAIFAIISDPTYFGDVLNADEA